MHILNNPRKKFSVIITFKKNTKDLEKCLYYLSKQTFKNFEVILVSENNIKIPNKFNYLLKIKKIVYKNKFPGVKRHIAAIKSKSNYLVFIDDDAYPKKNWLESYFYKIKKNKFEILGGPAIDEYKINTLKQRILSFIFKVEYFGGFPERYVALKEMSVDDWPTVNLCIKKEIYKKTNGLNYKFWPGEDSLLCNEIYYSLKKKIRYVPEAVVHHVRRNTIRRQIYQLFGYGKMRGYFFKNRIQNSFKIKFIIPSVFFLYNLFLFFFLFKINIVEKNIFIPLIIYFILNIYFTIKTIKVLKENIKLIFFFLLCNYINHNIYGLAFIFGLFKKKNKNF